MRLIQPKNMLRGLTAVVSIMALQNASAAIVISEVDSSGSSAAYAADWFELTNTGTSSVNISGWKMDDNSNSFSAAVALRGATSIAAGQSVVFLEGNTSGSNDASIDAAFISAWFGATPPAGLTLAGYGGSGVGLSTSGDAVNIFDSTGALITRVDLGAAPGGASFDNTAGLNNVTLATLSAVGVNGAFLSASGAEIGSPGIDAAPVPIPAAAILFLSGLGVFGRALKRRGTAAV